MTNPKIEFDDRMLSLGLARVSEAAAIASVSLIGRGDEKAADEAAVNAMREQLNLLDIAGTVVIGEGERDEAPMLYIGEEVGTGNGPGVDIALDPLEGTTLTAKDMPNALTVIAMGPKGSMLHAPDVYMEKLAVGPGFSPKLLSLDMSPYERVQILAEAKNCDPSDITVCILERPRHQDMIEQVRSTGAAIRLISDGDVAELCIVRKQKRLVLICIWELGELQKESLPLLRLNVWEVKSTADYYFGMMMKDFELKKQE